MRKGVKAAVVGGVVVVLLGGAGYGAYSVVSALNGSVVAGGASPVRTGPPDADEVQETTRKFFAAWEKGDARTAASYTNYPVEAQALLSA
ncbi:penicillin-binding protein, partial [Streptomyces sp. NPDC002812]